MKLVCFLPFSRYFRLWGSLHTRTVSDDSASPHFFFPAFLDQPQQRMKSTPGLESANSLKILTFEEEPELWPRGRLSFEWRADEGLGGLWGRRDGVESLAGKQWGTMDIWLNQSICSLNGGGGE